jgi:hypothetical protein
LGGYVARHDYRNALSGAFTIMAPGNMYISSQKEQANVRLAGEIMPALDYLDKEYSLEGFKPGLSSRPDIKKARDFVEAKINTANNSGESTRVFSWGLYEHSRITGLKYQLKHISQRDSVSSTNGTLLFACVFSFLTFVLSIYAIYALAKYKSLGFKGELIFFSLLVPVLGLTISLMFVNEYKGLEHDFTFNGTAAGFAMFFLISPFIFFPPAIISARKAGVSLVNVLKLKTLNK